MKILLLKKREITYKGKSKYSCHTAIELSFSAVPGNKHIETLVKLIPKEDLTITVERDYSL